MNKETTWGGVAGWYDELLEKSSDSYQEKVILPNLLRILDLRPGMTAVDIACGQGYFSRAMAGAGAKVIGCDVSGELIELAKKKGTGVGENSGRSAEKSGDGAAGAVDVEYHTAPSNKLDFIESGKADVAVIVLALQNIEDMAGTFSEVSRVLNPEKGRLVIVLNHPAFRIPGRSGWEWNEEEKKQSRRIDAYMSDFSASIDMAPGAKKPAEKKTTVSFHRPLQSYFKALLKAGFSVTRLEEWISHRQSQKGPRSAEEDRMRKEIPMFMCVEGRKQ